VYSDKQVIDNEAGSLGGEITMRFDLPRRPRIGRRS
jgi:hypothetical protein